MLDHMAPSAWDTIEQIYDCCDPFFGQHVYRDAGDNAFRWHADKLPSQACEKIDQGVYGKVYALTPTAVKMIGAMRELANGAQ